MQDLVGGNPFPEIEPDDVDSNEPYSDWSAKNDEEKEDFLKAIVMDIIALLAKEDYPTVIRAHPNDIDEIKDGLLRVDAGNPEYNNVIQSILNNIKWIGLGNECRMQTMRQEKEAKIAQYLNGWVKEVGLLDIAQRENVPIELLQHNDVLIQIFCSWIASKILPKKIITLGEF